MSSDRPASAPPFCELLQAELARRCRANPRYSLRAFARFLGIDHATLSQMLRGRRAIGRAMVARLGRRLGLDEATIAAQLLAARARPAGASDPAHVAHDAALIAGDGLHHALLRAAAAGAAADSRVLARQLGVSPDEVNVALQRLLRFGLLAMEGPGRWRDSSGAGSGPRDALVRLVWRRAAAALAEPTVPAAPSPAPQEDRMTPVVQFQLLAPDPEAAARFYCEAFGWRVTSDNALGYRAIAAAPGGIGGGIWPAPPEGAPMVQLFLGVEDVAAAAARAGALGARVVVPPQRLPDGDEMAILVDPQGIAFGLLRHPRGAGSAG